MSSRPSKRTLQLTIWIVLGACLLAFGLGSRHHLVVCTGECCSVRAAAAEESACGCCATERGADTAAARGDTGPDTGSHRAACSAGCCVDLCFDVGLGPLPRADCVALPEACWTETASRHDSEPPPAERSWPHERGPPRVDERTRLLASTVLRR
jgi:hypothetical protein